MDIIELINGMWTKITLHYIKMDENGVFLLTLFSPFRSDMCGQMFRKLHISTEMRKFNRKVT